MAGSEKHWCERWNALSKLGRRWCIVFDLWEDAGVSGPAEAGDCGELEKEDEELIQALVDCPQELAEEREVGMAIVDDIMVDNEDEYR
ncbi:hypothetical protein RRF57_001004 [Xylaria bambusicola]|uniref:Uncharacterized protein n=1 Tax=Xylaria bambusicola TaxID=326684 RepID=A0AAN7UD80_9PEZI